MATAKGNDMIQDLKTVEQSVQDIVSRMGLLKQQIQKVIVGQKEAIDQLLITFLAGGHGLLEGVPGLAKTLMIRTLAEAVDLRFRRIQFTPDLMPSDIIGTEVLEEDHATGKRFFKFNKGPLFSNIILADEINRTSPKTQSALLEAMQEFEVTYGGVTYALDRPFFILATQNPIEQSGTFPLPEAQLDRFLLYIRINYPTAEEEHAVLENTTGGKFVTIKKVIDAGKITEAQKLVREVHISADLIARVNTLVRSTRPGEHADKMVKDFVRWGAGPRAGQAMILTAKARAFLAGRFAVTLEDVTHMALPVLSHRVLLNFKAEAEGITADAITLHLVEKLMTGNPSRI